MLGGSSSSISIPLARAFRDLNFVVQVLPEAVDEAEKSVPKELGIGSSLWPTTSFYKLTSRRRCLSS